MGIRVRIKRNRVKQFTKKIEAEYEKRLDDAAEILLGHMRATLGVQGSEEDRSAPGEAPRRQTGSLVNSLRIVSKDNKRNVGTDDPRGEWLERGVRGGKVIRPKSAKVLSFRVDGEQRFARQVVQGDIAPRPWKVPALNAALPQIKKIMQGKF